MYYHIAIANRMVLGCALIYVSQFENVQPWAAMLLVKTKKIPIKNGDFILIGR